MTSRDRQPQTITAELEAFVQDVAVLQLEPEHQVKEKLKNLYRKHQYVMTDLFDYILTSRIWTDGMADSMEALLLSPTIDSNDQQLLVSAIMLSATEHFDIAKFRLLLNVYKQSTDEQVRQRALVGWVFALDADLGRSIYPEELQLVEQLLEDEACCKELTELQKQLIYCVNTEADNATIQREIMPDLLKQPGLRMTQHGLEEQEEDRTRANVTWGNNQNTGSSGNYNVGTTPFAGGGSLTFSNACASARSHEATFNGGANTATGTLSVADDHTTLHFADGANWAGTVLWNADRMDLVAAATNTVSFGTLDLASDFPIRVWKNGGTLANDTLNVGAP